MRDGGDVVEEKEEEEQTSDFLFDSITRHTEMKSRSSGDFP